MRVRTARSRRPARLGRGHSHSPALAHPQGLKNGRTYQVTATQSDGSGNTGSGHEPVHDLDEAGALVGEAELHEANRRERAEAGRSTYTLNAPMTRHAPNASGRWVRPAAGTRTGAGEPRAVVRVVRCG